MRTNLVDAVEGDFVAPHVLKDKRRVARRAAALPVQAILVDQDDRPAVPIKSRDLTGRGMGFVSPYPLAVGERVAVRFRLATGQYDLVLGRVRHSSQVGGAAGAYRGGIEFLAVKRMTGDAVLLPAEWVTEPDAPGGIIS